MLPGFRRRVRALLLHFLVIAVILAAPTVAADNPLIKAAHSGDTAEVEHLLAGGADVDHRDANGATALFMASQEGHGAIVEALLAKGAMIDVQANNGATALIVASQNGHGAIVEALLAKGADAELQLADGRTALDLARNAAIENTLRAVVRHRP